MAKDLQQLKDSDIVEERYKGANAAIAAAGEAYYAHYWMALVGLLGGGLLTYAFHKPIGKMVGNLRGVADKWAVNEENFAARWTGKSIFGVFGKGEEGVKELRQTLKENLKESHPKAYEKYKKQLVYEEKGFGFWLFDHTIGLYKPAHEWIKNATKGNEQISLALTSGGLLGAIGFFVAPWLYATKGVHNAFEGKDQFKRAQQEIKELREDLQFVEEKNAELRNELRAAKGDALNVSKDDTPKVEQRPITHPHDPHELDIHPTRKDDEIRHAKTEHKDAEDRGDAHTRHTHHTDRHKSQAGRSHGEAIREQQSAAATSQSVA